MSVEEKELSFSFKGRYFKTAPSDGIRQVWFVLHGYGQLAQYFVRNFQPLSDCGVTVIAPEALSRFYLEDVQSRSRSGNNRVGATWMTRENRMTDIENYLTFLNGIYSKEINDSSIPVTVFGFSQGAATASRWVLDGKINFDRLILWAGVLPFDMNFEIGKEILRNKKVVLIYGNNDPFLNDDRFAEMESLSSKLGINAETRMFEGGHEINQKTLIELV